MITSSTFRTVIIITHTRASLSSVLEIELSAVDVQDFLDELISNTTMSLIISCDDKLNIVFEQHKLQVTVSAKHTFIYCNFTIFYVETFRFSFLSCDDAVFTF